MASMNDVAKRAGVSLSTVSIVVNGNAEKRKISDETVSRVRKAMEEVHYIPNHYARNLRNKETPKYNIALFWSFDFRRVMMPRFLSGMQSEIVSSGANATVTIYPYTPGKLSDSGDLFQEGIFSAAVIANAEKDDLDFLAENDFPVNCVLYNTEMDGMPSVSVDNEAIGRSAAEHLYAMGYRRPAVIYSRYNFPGAGTRERAFCAAFSRHGIDVGPESFIETENSVDGGAACADGVSEMLAAGDGTAPDCFFCVSDMIALGFANALKRRGTDIPDDVGVIAVGNGEPQYSKNNDPSITVINIPMEEMGRSAFRIIFDGMYKTGLPVRREILETELIAGKTTDRSQKACEGADRRADKEL